MCTATYLPGYPNDLVLTHSRNEKVMRPAARPPGMINLNGQRVPLSQDLQGQGTWIATSSHTTVCLLVVPLRLSTSAAKITARA